jgi:ABC-type glycerol-3-phosphate transport system substrate-binding protein
MGRFFKAAFWGFLIFCTAFLTGCKKSESEKSLSYQARKSDRSNKIVIWTSSSEFAQYSELFNKIYKNDSAVIVYKENPALSLPPASDEEVPDIIVGSWLRTEKIPSDFKSLDYIFDYKNLSYDIFYPQLLETGRYFNSQYLLPVSFNIPAIIFSSENSSKISDDYILSLEQLRSLGSEYNKYNKKGNFTRIGFVPLGNDDFLYQAAKLSGVDFRLSVDKIVWNEDALTKTEAFLRDWVITENESAKTEEDFTFKYLFMPDYRQVTSGRTLFAYTTSDRLFKILKDQVIDIDYRWLYAPAQNQSENSEKTESGSIPVDDSLVMLGIYKYAKNVPGATEFISWFFDAESQRQILQRKTSLNLETEQFGIAGGFSAVQNVTEQILPLFYTALLSNLPPAHTLSVPQVLPARWESYLSMVVKPYLRAAIEADDDDFDENGNYVPAQTIESLETEWRKKVFD